MLQTVSKNNVIIYKPKLNCLNYIDFLLYHVSLLMTLHFIENDISRL